MPAIYPYREVTQADGLLSYGTNIADIVRQAGVMAGKVLKGAKPPTCQCKRRPSTN